MTVFEPVLLDARLLRSDRPDERQVGEKIGIVFPNQGTWGTHVNISGAGYSRTRAEPPGGDQVPRVLASDEAQRYFADGNNEWPVVANVRIDNPVLKQLGAFKRDQLNVAVLGKNQPSSQKLYDRVAWK